MDRVLKTMTLACLAIWVIYAALLVWEAEPHIKWLHYVEPVDCFLYDDGIMGDTGPRLAVK